MRRTLKHGIILMQIVFLMMITLGCQRQVDYDPVFWHEYNSYRHEQTTRLTMSDAGSFTILQLTDLHLTFGFGYLDRSTFQLMDYLIREVNPQLIVLTGDLTMSPLSPRLYKKLGKFLDQYEIPWTYLFGNHDGDYSVSLQRLVKTMEAYDFNLFDRGPENVEGVGNYYIHIVDQEDNIIQTLFFFDSHSTRDYQENGQTVEWYDYIYPSQIYWYEDQVNKIIAYQNKMVPSFVFTHTPLPEFEHIYSLIESDYEGYFGEAPCVPLENTGFFARMVALGSTQAVFVGHDHLNDFAFELDNILLAYGRITGFSAYGNKQLERGARVIEIFSDGSFETYVTTKK